MAVCPFNSDKDIPTCYQLFTTVVVNCPYFFQPLSYHSAGPKPMGYGGVFIATGLPKRCLYIETFSTVTGILCGEFTGHRWIGPPHKSQWQGDLMFSLICAWINGWVNKREAGDLRRHRAHYDVIVIYTPDRRCLHVHGSMACQWLCDVYGRRWRTWTMITFM